MRILNTWRGPADTYVSPNASGQEILTAETTSRWLPFKDKSMAMDVLAPGAKNRSGQSLGAVHAGIETADEKARRDNFKW